MPDSRLRFVVRTPHDVVVDMMVASARVATETGQVGLRPRMEPIVLAVEAGLVVLRTEEGRRFAGSAGGLLSCDGREATLFTPIGVLGDNADAITGELERALAEPGAEQKVRATLDRLEGRILLELRRSPRARPSATGDGE
jgi:F0F1-type ATP synthase epsilon subunit